MNLAHNIDKSNGGSGKPAPSSVYPQNIPDELKRQYKWVCWRWEKRNGTGKWTKPPYQVNGEKAETDAPSTWNSFDRCFEAYQSGDFDGIGFVLNGQGNLVGIDLDHFVDENGGIAPDAQKIVDAVGSYTEVSPSGDGLRIFCKGEKPGGRCKRGPYEMYSTGHYLTLTGNRISQTSDIVENQEGVDAAHAMMFPEKPTSKPTKTPDETQGEKNIPSDDAELIDGMFRSKNGATLRGLWEGNIDAFGSHSEADIALCGALAWWTDGDANRIDSLFRQSGLMRKKWDEKRPGGTYGSETVKKAIAGNHGRRDERRGSGQDHGNGSGSSCVSEKPRPLPKLPGVMPFDYDLLPERLAPYVRDVSERLQCPADYVAVGLMVALSAIVGRKVGIRPQRRTDWTTVCNLWGCIVGRPSLLKSPALEEAMKPLNRLIAKAQEKYDEEDKKHKGKALEAKLRVEAKEKQARAELKNNPDADVSDLLTEVEEPDPPILKRYRTNDSTPEALCELLRQNPNGLLVFRDELVSLLRGLDREDKAAERGFYLTAWNGDSHYTEDRIGRGFNLSVNGACISLLGGTQPGRLASYVQVATSDGAANDGLIQRFGLLVWPDSSKTWKDVDRWPDKEAKRQAFKVFEELDRLDPESIGAAQERDINGDLEGVPFLRFDDEALKIFRQWRSDLETRLRDESLHPAVEEHLGKYKKHVPALALIIHLVDNGGGPVDAISTGKALAWAEYLESHAERAYGAAIQPDVAAAKAILRRIKNGDLKDGFTARDIYRRGWSGLDREKTEMGLRLLVDYDYLEPKTHNKGQGGGEKTSYRIVSGE